MQHYFGKFINGKIELGEEETHHLIDVKRAEIGEKVEISSGGKTILCQISSLRPLKFKILESYEETRELPTKIELAFSLLKSDHNELIVLKGTELGISSFSPFVSSRCLIKPEQKEDKKLLRMRKIAKEGAEQCRRASIPCVNEYSDFDHIINKEADLKLLAYEDAAIDGKNILHVLEKAPLIHRILVLIGPEGGFSPKEANAAIGKGFVPVSLGKRILRAETAALYASSIISAFLEAK